MTTVRLGSVRPMDAPPITRTETQVLLGAAGLAPSVMNTQPWSFEIRGKTIDIYADPSRALRSSVDPSGRQMVISCGAALFNLRVAAAYLGREVTVRLNPEPSDLLASIRLGQRGRANPQEAALFSSIRRRHTHRKPFAPRAVPGSVLFELTQCVHSEHAVIVPISRGNRKWLFDLIALAEASLTQSPNYESDMYKWTAGGSSRVDGVPVHSFGTLSSNGAPPMRDFGATHGITQPAERYAPDPWTAILATATDDKIAWLHAGQALQRLLLTSCNLGLAVSFLNQPLDDPDIRQDLTANGLGGHPQMILRMGYGTGDGATPRRPIDDLVRRRRPRKVEADAADAAG